MDLNFLKKDTEKEPAYYYSATKFVVSNYKVYYMSKKEKIIFFLLGFIVGGAVGYLFYGGIGKDEMGPTIITYICDFLSILITGTIAGFLVLPMIVSSKIEKRKRALAKQFRDMLDALTTSIGAGKNVHDAFLSAKEDLSVQYDKDADILNELEAIILGLRNSVPIEDLLVDFGKRSGINDIVGFANVFKICYYKGGNIRDVIRNTHIILSDKMNIKEEIETLITSNKFEQNIMVVMPLVLVALIKFSSPEFAENFTTTTGIVSTTIAVVMFVVAYLLGKKLMNIKF